MFRRRRKKYIRKKGDYTVCRTKLNKVNVRVVVTNENPAKWRVMNSEKKVYYVSLVFYKCVKKGDTPTSSNNKKNDRNKKEEEW